MVTPTLKRTVFVFVVLASLLWGLSSCGRASAASQIRPIVIGVSLSTSGDFSDDSRYFKQGYQLWADTINHRGGLLGRPVVLKILNDASTTEQVITNYQSLITVDHVDLLFAPFSSFLTKPAAKIASRYDYAFPEGAGTAPSVFALGLKNLFCVSLPASQYLTTFANYVLTIPQRQRPMTAVYATADDAFAQPPVAQAQQMLEQGGVRTVGSAPGQQIVWQAETTDYTPIAEKIIATHAQVVILGTTAIQDSIALTRVFKQQHYNPQMLIETSGPDQVDQFLSGVGNPDGIFVPNSWWPDSPAVGNAQMIADYTARYHVAKASVSSDVAQAYSAAQVMQQAIEHTHSLDNRVLINQMRILTFNTVQGAVRFDSTGQNTLAIPSLFQWQGTQLLPVYPTSIAQGNPEFPKHPW
jgi:branched-chain amino acid transport system substrate-binding protein